MPADDASPSTASERADLEQRIAEALFEADGGADLHPGWNSADCLPGARAVIPLVREAVLAEVAALIERDFRLDLLEQRIRLASRLSPDPAGP